jgi:hypothetical protein
MLIVVFAALHAVSERLNAVAQSGPITLLPISAAPRISLAPQVSAGAAAAPPEATPASSEVVDVDPKTLTNSPAVYRSRRVRVKGAVFYTGKLADGKTWVQIVGDDNVYVDGEIDSLPPGITKGVQVQVTGIGAGLTNITASNGKDYDQAFIDPIETIEPLSSQ